MYGVGVVSRNIEVPKVAVGGAYERQEIDCPLEMLHSGQHDEF